MEVEAAFLAEFRRRLDAEQTVAIATIVEGSGIGRQLVFDPFGEVLCGDLGSASLNDQVRRYVSALVPGFRCEKTSVTTDDGDAVAVFIEVHGPRPQLVVVGAVHVAVPLLHFARILGWRTVVVDPRPVFASAARFGHADVLLVEWPHEAFERIHLHDNTYVAVLSHDLKIDIPAIAAALRRRLPYVGALGSKKTQAKRVRALVDDGFTEADLASLRSPIGLDLGGRRAEDVALAIIAEIVAVTQDGSAARQVRSVAGGLPEAAMNQARSDPARELLRHAVATLAYRGAKALRGVTDDVARHKLGASTRTPLQILGHINDLLDWALQLCEGRQIWHDSAPDSWTGEVERFHAGLTALDNRLASADPLGHSPERLFQGPIADALTHVGQIALVRRLAGSPQRGENYFKAHIAIGCVGPRQPAPVREFE